MEFEAESNVSGQSSFELLAGASERERDAIADRS
jgi:hypothetical protein